MDLRSLRSTCGGVVSSIRELLYSVSGLLKSIRVPQPVAPAWGGKARTTIASASGKWEIGETIGAGSTARVKLGRNLGTNELVAIKTIPQLASTEAAAAEREAATLSLLCHPSIIAIRDVVRTDPSWYLVLEHADGGQLLDYMIRHGRLKERQARKFARQIASALDYCHRNNIAHRSLKLEKIMLTQSRDVKLIGFGSSSLFTPESTLETPCGSSYYAAPEIIAGKPYEGPQVDVWGFGIVLYILVCGRVPFDAVDMPGIHEKITNAAPEFPSFVSRACAALISQMLEKDPVHRATMLNVLTHPWMTRRYAGAPRNLLPHRAPLVLPLDEEVIAGMAGFGFGAPDEIHTQLTKIVESGPNQCAAKSWGREQRGQMPPPATHRSRCVLGNHSRREPVIDEAGERRLWEELNPDPLVSVYYLAREKLERNGRAIERVVGMAWDR